MWWSVPMAGKLDPRWEGEWVVKSVKSSISTENVTVNGLKVACTNRVRRRYIPDVKDCTIYGANDAKTCAESCARGDWVPPGIEHVILPSSENMFESVSC